MEEQPSLLIVDDTPENLRILGEMLEQDGYIVRVATNGLQALQNAKASPPVLILLDILMPGMDGYEVCRQLKADPDLSNVPVIFISALDRADQKIRAFREGGVDYISKPFHVDEVLARVRVHCQISKLEELKESEERLKLALSGADLGTWDWNILTGEVHYDARYAAMLGYSLDEFEPHLRQWEQLIHPDERKDVQHALDLHLQGNTDSYASEHRLRNKSGNWIWVLDKGKVIRRDAQGRPLRLCGTHLDITERKQSEQALRTSQAELKAALSSMTDAVFISDAAGQFIHFNEAFASIHRFSSIEECARNFLEYPDILEVFMANGERAPLDMWAVPRALRGEIATNAEYMLRRRDTGETWIGSYSFSPIRDKEGTIVGSVVVGRDITEKKQAEKAIQESEERQRLILESAAEGIYGIDMDGNCVFCNSACVSLLGYQDANELIGKNMHYQIHHKHRDETPYHIEDCRLFQAFISGVNAHVDDEVFWRSDGTSFPTEYWSYPQRRAGVIVGAVVSFFDITERKHAEEKLRETSEQLDMTLRSTGVGIWHWDALADKPRFDDQTCRLLGIDVSVFNETMDEFFNMVHPEDRELVRTTVLKSIEDDLPYESEFRVIWPDESVHHISIRGWIVRDDQKRPLRIDGVVWDVTEQKLLEEQLLQAQKMEAIGHLAGGVAHDFNNLLQVIMINTELVLGHQTVGSPTWEQLDEVSKATMRATDLTRQLLAFSRRQVIHLVNINLNDLVLGILKMLRRLIGEHIELCSMHSEPLGNILADKGQIEQIIMNLCLNARDAMPNGGRITIETRNEIFTRDYCRQHLWANEGTYALLSVTDTGEGMDASTRSRIFEPFFTTKGFGKGTGLGLATVYGIVKQHMGLIHVYSEPGTGTVFKVYLPVVEDEVIELVEETKPFELGGNETILVAEDDLAILKTLVMILRAAGYTVLDASNGTEALRLFEENAENIDLVILDVMMPGMSGKEVMNQIQIRGSRVPFLFSSGYSENAIHTNFVIHEGLHLIQKPYSKEVLLREVRQILDASASERKE